VAFIRIEDCQAHWLGRRGIGGARFTRQQLGRIWSTEVALASHITVAEAGLLLRRHRDLLYDWIEKGAIRPTEVGTYVGQDGSRTTVLMVSVVREIYRRIHKRYPTAGFSG
jgi:hypothetical protein